MKIKCIEFIASSRLKTKLQQEATLAKISVGELIRQKFELSEDEEELKKSYGNPQKRNSRRQVSIIGSAEQNGWACENLKSSREFS